MKKLPTMLGAAVIAGVAMFPIAVQARSRLYYFDFDTVEGGALVYNGTNKGTAQTEVWAVKSPDSGDTTGYYTSNCALGSAGTFSAHAGNSLWLNPDGSTSLGCGTTSGFTMSFWLMASGAHAVWSDFMGFRVGSTDYRLEYGGTVNDPSFYIFTTDATTGKGVTRSRRLDGTYGIFNQTVKDTWKHVALVFAPGTNAVGVCTVYIGGEKVGTMDVAEAGELKRVCFGRNVPYAGTEHKSNKSYTRIDEFAVFDYPATAEQVKWLGKFRPAQPAAGPARAMPQAWQFHTYDLETGVLPVNSGTGPDAMQRIGSAYANFKIDGGALGSTYAFHFRKNDTYFRAAASDADGLGATVGSGYTFSFWLYAPSNPTPWKSIFGFEIGSRGRTYMAYSSGNNIRTMNASGTGLEVDNAAMATTANAWQHFFLVFNPDTRKTDVYVGGEKKAALKFSTSGENPDDSEAVTALEIGPYPVKGNGKYSTEGVYADEVAFFNHSLSPWQMTWLSANIPALPPLDATNLVRTVSTDCVWDGGRASWCVNEWNGEGWVDSTRTTIYPSCEDTQVEVELKFASNATVSNDTFVACRKLVLSNATDAQTVSPTLVRGEGAFFAPQEMALADGVQLNVPAGFDNPLTVGGTLRFGSNAKIIFDADALSGSDADEGAWNSVMTFNSVELPDGETNVLSHFCVSSGKYRLSLSTDGRAVLARRNHGLTLSFY